MNKLKPLTIDLSIFNKFEFETHRQPVGVKFIYETKPPEGVEKLDKAVALCEMFVEAQKKGTPFYCDKENENCSGKLPLGWMEMPAWAESGKIGEKFEIFEDLRANQRLYDHFYEFKPGLIKYLAFSRIDHLNFDPDLLLISARPRQAEVVLRAMTYSTGELWQPKATPVLGCSWFYVYPYKTGNVNYMFTGMHFGMIAREAYPEGYVLISIPYNWIPTITANLNKMKWVLPAYSLGKEEWLKHEEQAYKDLAEE